MIVPTGLSGCTGLSVGQNITLALGTPAITGINLSASSVVNGSPVTATFVVSTPAGPIEKQIAVSATGNVGYQSNIVLPEGQTSVAMQITTPVVNTQTTSTITATYNGATATATFTILPLNVYGVTFSPTSLVGGNTDTCTVTMTGAAGASGATVAITGTGPWTLPSTVNVAAGVNSVSFPITTSAVSTSTNQSVTATLGSSSKVASFTATPAAILSASAYPSNVVGGNATDLTVSLASPAGSSGDVVTLSGTGPLTLPKHHGACGGHFGVRSRAHFYREFFDSGDSDGDPWIQFPTSDDNGFAAVRLTRGDCAEPDCGRRQRGGDDRA